MTCRDYIQLPLDVDGIYASIDTKILKTPQNILLHLVYLDNGRNPDIGTFKKYRGYIFQNPTPKALKKNYYVMSMKYYLKWLKQPQMIHIWNTQLPQHLKMRSLHSGKYMMIKRLGL